MRYDPEIAMLLERAEGLARNEVPLSERTHAWLGALLVMATGAVTTGAAFALMAYAGLF